MNAKLNFIFIFITGFYFGQFNTLTYFNAKEENEKIELQNQKKQMAMEVETQREKKPKKKRTFTTKADLKKELDSIKLLILESQKIDSKKENQNKVNVKKLEDSLIQIIENRVMRNIGTTKTYRKYDLVEDKEPESISKLHMPLKGRLNITSPFGVRTHPIFGGQKMHNGIDLGANYENVYSVLDGVVTEAGWDTKGGGNYIKVRHSDRFETAYLHLSQIYYKAGEQVKGGYIIAKSGNSGNSTRPHLHFSVKEYGNFINPVRFLNDLIKVNNLIALYNEG